MCERLMKYFAQMVSPLGLLRPHNWITIALEAGQWAVFFFFKITVYILQ